MSPAQMFRPPPTSIIPRVFRPCIGKRIPSFTRFFRVSRRPPAVRWSSTPVSMCVASRSSIRPKMHSAASWAPKSIGSPSAICTWSRTSRIHRLSAITKERSNLIDRPQVEPSHMSMVKRTVFVALTVVLVCAPIGLAELYLRYVGLGDPILFYANASYRFAPLPNQQKRRLGGASVTIDSRGLRSTHDWSEPADVKILFVGDSVTWGGTYIDDADTFAEGVCQRLARATGKSVVCGNAGANEYGTDNMAERIRYKDFNDETALVVTMIGTDTTRGL